MRDRGRRQAVDHRAEARPPCDYRRPPRRTTESRGSGPSVAHRFGNSQRSRSLRSYCTPQKAGRPPPWELRVNGKLQQPNPDRTTNGSHPSRMKIWVTPPGKESWPAEVLAKDEGNAEWIVEEVSVDQGSLCFTWTLWLRISHKVVIKVLPGAAGSTGAESTQFQVLSVVVGRIQFLKIVKLRFLVPSWLLAKGCPQFLGTWTFP
ncbi:uncharacterized protein LOC113927884 [Zalophus californianus]|uniref:Uncharacterized protein LOC113927884 n=1 Tax=Zalophus californianus TaxID=9704 RepID=A0A6J2DYR1_ZALCA|nr:uncharacterized protein LOC113927884 [Zalophus californianus]